MVENQSIGELAARVAAGLADPATGWSIGAYGAIAEFRRVAGDPEPVVEATAAGGRVATARGALAVALVPGARLVEGRDIAICLDAETGAMAGRDVIAELGPDDDAIRGRDRGAILFDLGLGLPHVDFCVRTDDPDLAATLRAGAGVSLFDAGNPAFEAVKRASPHRVAVSRLGRIEVYQPIASRARGIALPDGPHTHLLPLLLARRRADLAEAPVPDGWFVALAIHAGDEGH